MEIIKKEGALKVDVPGYEQPLLLDLWVLQVKPTVAEVAKTLKAQGTGTVPNDVLLSHWINELSRVPTDQETQVEENRNKQREETKKRKHDECAEDDADDGPLKKAFFKHIMR